MTKYTMKDATNDLRDLLSLTKIYTADDEGRWIAVDNGEPFLYQADKRSDPKEVVLFQDPVPDGDFHFFNPFAESLEHLSPASSAFYQIIRLAMNLNFIAVLKHVAKSVVESNADTSIKLSPAVLRMANFQVDPKTSFAKYADQKFLDELETILKNLGPKPEILFVPYTFQNMRSKLFMSIFTDDFAEKFEKAVRKKSMTAFRMLVLSCLGVSSEADLAEKYTYQYSSSLGSNARLHSILTIYLRVYEAINDILPEATADEDGVPDQRSAIDLGRLNSIIERLPLANAFAKHVIMPTVSSTTSVAPVNSTSTINTAGVPGAGPKFGAPPGMTPNPAIGAYQPAPNPLPPQQADGRRFGGPPAMPYGQNQGMTTFLTGNYDYLPGQAPSQYGYGTANQAPGYGGYGGGYQAPAGYQPQSYLPSGYANPNLRGGY